MRSSLPIDETIVRGIYYTMYRLGVAFKFYLLVFKLYMSSASIQKYIYSIWGAYFLTLRKQNSQMTHKNAFIVVEYVVHYYVLDNMFSPHVTFGIFATKTENP